MNHRMKKAFTLVELLVVITIIGMLMAMLLPGVQAAREAGRRALCIGNERNVAQAFICYNAMYGKIPGGGGGGGWGSTWTRSIAPFLDRIDLPDAKGLKVMMCPSNPGQAQGYGVNSELGQANLNTIHDGAAYTILLAESINGGSTVSSSNNRPTSRHGGGANVSFCDGHQYWLRDDLPGNTLSLLMNPNNGCPKDSDF
jgi:prepilin-type N-terminal cleavage/methylation domain-containing protein/prepilin-type processing-associated H-X9-DG protein